MCEEIWKDIKGYEGLYQISNNGQVRSVERTIIFKDGRKRIFSSVVKKQRINMHGYYTVDLCKNTNNKTVSIHRLIAEYFIENPYNKEFVNHKDGVKTNNSISNLEWTTPKENFEHAVKMGLAKHIQDFIGKEYFKGKKHTNETKQKMKKNSKRKRKVINLTTNKVFDSATEGAKFYGIDNCAVAAACRGVYKTFGGYRWAYYSE